MQHDLIPNSRFRFMNHPGTGNKSTKVSAAEKLRLTNIVVDRKMVDDFLKVLYATGERRISVKLSSRRTYSRWGTAWSHERRCIIYRHTVWVTLHELAHILDIKKDFTGNRIRNNKPHGPDFGRCLKYLYELWMEHMDTGQTNAPVKAEKQPDLFDLADRAIPNKWRVPERRPRLVGGIKLQVGDKVWFRARGQRIEAKVIKVNKKTCRVTPLDGSRDWRVSPKLLNKIEGDVDIPITKEVYNGLKDAMAFDRKPAKKKMSAAEREEIMTAWRAKFRKNK